jgi:hypothetical protein
MLVYIMLVDEMFGRWNLRRQNVGRQIVCTEHLSVYIFKTAKGQKYN